uniref:RNase H type-1 domain-containing protein n=1 Tax=Eutreptiella gymnastica TaxID=73025 RepID=A0A7S1I363_9EUGL|mmetsp:Transcript_125713/g.217974  ORF Transcript_125713/g.217974 Transcript_125713/m.217974 type:complete len:103 (+) Transcript_125713:178-486(+)
MRAVLHALQKKASSQKLCLILNAKMICKGIVEWMFKWRRHGWKGSSGPVGHSDLGQQIHSLVIMHGDTLRSIWVPEDNEQADKRAEKGRLILLLNRRGDTDI